MPVLLIEPASDAKRRRVSGMLREPARPAVTEDGVRQRLSEMRTRSLAHVDTLIAGITGGFSPESGLEVTFAADARQAVEAILGIAGNSEIAVNRSAVVANELAPLLASSGREVILSYPQEFPSHDSTPREYWELPGMPFESRFCAFERMVDLSASRALRVETNGTKDYIALLGVNAVSADGAIVMLQHMQNVSKIFEEAKDVVFVAGIDKVVASCDEAVFQTQCMAAFGSEVLPLGFGAGKSGRSTEELPSKPSTEPGAASLHLLLLDNGRSRTMRGPYGELLTCIDCRACTKGCPGSQFFSEDARLSPREYLYFSVTGQSPSLDRCLQCKTCRVNCPLQIDIPGMVVARKAELQRRRRPRLADFVLARGGTMGRWGSLAPRPANFVLRAALFHRAADVLLGISPLRHLPTVSRRSFARWYASRPAHK